MIPFSKRAALFKPPPLMVEEAYNWVEQAYAQMCYDRIQDTTQETRKLKEMLESSFIENLSPIQTSIIQRRFPVNLGNWYKIDRNPEFNSYLLIISIIYPPGIHAAWSHKYKHMIIFVGDMLYPSSTQDFYKNLDSIYESLWHELIHLGQSALASSVAGSKEILGVPSKKRKQKTHFDEMGRPPNWRELSESEFNEMSENYDLHDAEFQPLLQEEINNFKNIAKRMSLESRPLLLKVWIYPFNMVENQIKNNKDMWFQMSQLTGQFFKNIFNLDKKRWRDAVVKFVKSVEDLL